MHFPDAFSDVACATGWPRCYGAISLEVFSGPRRAARVGEHNAVERKLV